jgi:diadenosine tetraphosphate (Ap4A) HIT family hydrolase
VGDPENDLIARMLPGAPYVRRVMLESPSFAAMPSLGPLTGGHSLLCPKAHLRSFAQLDPAAYVELEAVGRTLTRRLQELYGLPVHLFEHGMARSGGRVVCTVDHAHLHFVPLPQRCRLDLGSGWTVFDGSLTELARLSGGREYVTYVTPEGASWLLVARQGPIPSQHMRRLIAAALGDRTHWNWRRAPRARSTHETWRRFVSARGA